jgi:methylated-DNA-[protein]-cysteine S-methyltransferase
MSNHRLERLLEILKILLLTIPIGKVTTYKALSKVLGVHPRVVGRLLALNNEPIIVPCHRVVRSDGSLGGYSGPGGVDFKRKLLKLEGVRFCGRNRVCPEHVISSLNYSANTLNS